MSPTAQAVLTSWSLDWKLVFGLIALLFVYLHGWQVLHRILPNLFPVWRLAAFLVGLTMLWLAIASPLDAFSGLLLSAHMVQHFLLMFVAPPLILLGAPVLPLLRGLPRGFVHDGLGPFLNWSVLRRFGNTLTHPVVGGLAMAVSLCAWHLPAAFDFALRSPGWHKFEHACFFGTSLLFWWPVVRPFPNRPHWPLWAIPLYLLAADVVNTMLCAILTFSDRPLYSSYEIVPRLFGTTVLDDQVAAGVIMWVPGSLIFLVPATILAIQYLSPDRALLRAVESGAPPVVPWRKQALPRAVRPRFDLLTIPLLGRFLRAHSGRRVMQAALLVIALAVIADGIFGSQVSGTNLAGALPWIYWRGLVVVVLLVAGNFFCMACPFMLPRELARRLGLQPRNWPRALRTKWLAIALLALFFWAYEAFDLWNKPASTAWLILGYFFAAFIIDAFFRRASFCKYVCPIGQFQFISSLVSPLEVKAREPAICTNCKTHDCLRGNDQNRGCETDLFIPGKVGNLDCTFCLDCVRSCPHDNIGLLATVPGTDVVRDPVRSSLGRLSHRVDIAALAIMLVFAAFAGAAAMVDPIAEWKNRLLLPWGSTSPFPFTIFFFLAALVLIPASVICGATLLGRAAGRVTTPMRELLCRFSLALVPLGTAMWAAHFLFHLLTSYGSAWPLLQQAAGHLRIHLLGNPDWIMPRPGVSADTLLGLQILLLDAGLLLTLYVGWCIARQCALRVAPAIALLAPWACAALALYASGIWIFLQPMPMRGMIMTAMP